jgi:hypothetical protein
VNRTGWFVALNRLFSRNHPLQLAALAFGSALIYLIVFTGPFPLTRLFNRIPPLDYTKLTNYSLNGLLAYGLGIGLLFWLYIWAIRLVLPEPDRPDLRPGRMIAFVGSAWLAAISIFAYPLTAIDLFIYAIRSRGWALYGLNPLATAPDRLPAADPWLELAAEWIDAASPYGPLWEVLSLGAFHLSGGAFLAHLLALKLLMAAAYLGCAGLIYHSLARLRPQWALAGMIAFAWNPLVIMESVQNGHNDILMTFFLLLALWGFSRWQARPLTPGPSFFWLGWFTLALTLSILLKFVTVVALPFLLVGLAGSLPGGGRRWLVPGLVGGVVTILTLSLMAPLWPGWEHWAVLSAGSQAGRSLLALLVLAGRERLGTNPAFDLARNLLLFAFALIYLYYLGQAWRAIFDQAKQQTAADLVQRVIRPLFFVLFWYVLLSAPVFHAWYLLWFVPLAALSLPDQRPLLASLVFSMTALLVIPYFETIRVWYPYLLQNHFLGHLIGVPLLLIPPAITALWPVPALSPIRPTPDSEV